jgi:hypothetical protein
VVIAWKMKGKSGYTAVGTKLIYSNADTRAWRTDSRNGELPFVINWNG